MNRTSFASLFLLCLSCSPVQPDGDALETRRSNAIARVTAERERELNYGRYTFATATITTLEGRTEHLALKLDTQTGRAWRLDVIQVQLNSGVQFRATAWGDVADNLQTQISAAEAQDKANPNPPKIQSAEDFLNQTNQ